ncbi:glycoside hydrolase family 3 C-terminal domain-containing protein [Sphingomonas sp. LB-2]|uniref:glycoside hydrolase family 3 C-terminal domain-containing protein n=1 Tax=Sphingomonas caeni TaxID=2984949 RepID=UPI0022303411|nr:glycoside hydrolase family 3 C-terminal domain-containing protein [Sphingomonas caeni]MCW3848231.1 glycoside hydrolase family 3 C-terminal domain-containing protein [Sphingomonas caeni]
MNRRSRLLAAPLIGAAIALTAAGFAPFVSGADAAPARAAAAPAHPWMNPKLSPDKRAQLAVAAMTNDEKLVLVFGYFGTDFGTRFKAHAEARAGSAGYVPGIPRLGIPAQWETDAGVGVATQGGAAHKRERTALPSGLATTATWNPDTAFAGGAMIGREARMSGFNVMLAGGVDLLREPRNGRNFEYGGEDPWLAGVMVGSQVKGIQSNNIISTIKHYAVNDQETDRGEGNSIIEESAARQSDLLAFQFAIEAGNPGSIMCSYNKVNGTHACEHPWLLTQVLRTDWGFKGYVMADWGATHSTVAAANAGLEQDSGFGLSSTPYFGEPLKAAVAKGEVSQARLDQMATRILRAMFANGLFDHPITEAPLDLPAADLAKHADITRADAEESMVLMKNDGAILPLSPDVKSIVIVGGHADKGVLAGSGSSLVYPVGGNAAPGIAPTGWPGPRMYYPNSPMAAIQRQAPNAKITYVSGDDPAAAARAARKADVALVFATQWVGEAFDVSLTLADNQDTTIWAVAAANPKTVVVLETGGPVLTPWADEVEGLVEAWLPGTAGGDAIANVLFGKVNPSGHLPATFPKSLDQLPKPSEPNKGDTTYSEGAAVGYKWYDAKGLEPAFPFGWGLSYTSFDLGGLTAKPGNGTIMVSFSITNTGKVAGAEVGQVYVSGTGWEAPKRLGGFEKFYLKPGETKTARFGIDPRLLATWDLAGHCWRIAGGTYTVILGASARETSQTVQVTLKPRTLPATWRPGR